MTGPRTRQSPWNNPPPISKNELAEDAPGAPTEGSSTPTPSPAISPALTPVPAQAPTPAPGLPGMYTNIDLQKATRLALELFV